VSLVYQAYVRSFARDFVGAQARLDHLERLGIDALWLSPIHPSPNVDWGYDVADYYDVHRDYGTLADYDALIAAARERNIDVWLDLVPNHTSDQHAWFEERPEQYVWSKNVPNDWTSIFTGKSAWRWHEGRQQYYLHQFAPQQPDLDWWNPDVRAEFGKVLRFWFDRGVRGLRIDVAHGLIKDKKLRNGQEYLRNRPEVHEIYAHWQKIAAEYDPKPVLMGETYVPLEELPPYWQHLDLAQNMWFLRAEFEIDELRPNVERVMREIPHHRVPVWFGSNHDHSRMATRWAKGDPAKHEAALFLLLTLPGTAILYQGDEIGLEDGIVPPNRIRDIATPSRDPERTPMPWTRGGDEWRDPWLPLADTSRNVEDQEADPASILSYTRDLIRARKDFSNQSYETLDSPAGVWAYRRGDKTCALNMTAKPQAYDGTKLAPWEGAIV
jgi:alpha-glucosidase